MLEISSISDARPILDLMDGYGYESVGLAGGEFRPKELEPPTPSAAGPGAATFEYFNVCFRRRVTHAER